jgi:hypothetical protein
MARLWEDDQLCRRLSVAGRERARTWTESQFAEALHSLIAKLTAFPENQDRVSMHDSGLVAAAS